MSKKYFNLKGEIVSVNPAAFSGELSQISFSVVVPTCDRPRLLKRAVASVLAQARPASEIIIVDNGSQKVDPSDFPEGVLIIDAPTRVGVARARNIGVQTASGNWVAFLDDDDFWDERYLEEVSHACVLGSSVFVAGAIHSALNGQRISGKNERIAHRGFRILRRNPGLGGSNCVIHRQTFIDLGGYDADLVACEDIDLAFRATRQGIRITRAPHAVVFVDYAHSLSRLTDPQFIIPAKSQLLSKHVGNWFLRLALKGEYRLRRFIAVRRMKK